MKIHSRFIARPLNRFTRVESIQPGFQVLSNGHESIQRTRFNGFKFNRRRQVRTKLVYSHFSALNQPNYPARNAKNQAFRSLIFKISRGSMPPHPPRGARASRSLYQNLTNRKPLKSPPQIRPCRGSFHSLTLASTGKTGQKVRCRQDQHIPKGHKCVQFDLRA